MDDDNRSEVEQGVRSIATGLNRIERATGTQRSAHASVALVGLGFETDEATYLLRRENHREKNSGLTTWHEFEWFVEKTTKIVTKEL